MIEARTCCEKPAELRQRIVGVAPQLVWQCLTCGKQVGGTLKRSAAPMPSEMFAEELREVAWLERLGKMQEERHSSDTQWWSDYHDYMHSPEWSAKRAKVLRRASKGGTLIAMCEGCGEAPAAEVHHLSYAHFGDEFLWELSAVCGRCHDRLHD